MKLNRKKTDTEALFEEINQAITKPQWFVPTDNKEDVVEYTGTIEDLEQKFDRNDLPYVILVFKVDSCTDESHVQPESVLHAKYDLAGPFAQSNLLNFKRTVIGLSGGDPATRDPDTDCPKISDELLKNLIGTRCKVVQSMFEKKSGKIWFNLAFYKA